MHGALGRGRTGMTLRPTDFHTYYGFRRRIVCVRGLERAMTMASHATRVRSPPSALYTFSRISAGAWLGVASGLKTQGFHRL